GVMDRVKCLLNFLILIGFLGIFDPAKIIAQGTFFKFSVTEEGVYKITALQAIAMGAGAVDELSVYGYGGMLPQLLDSSIFDLKEIPVKEIEGELFFYLSAAPNIAISNGEAT